jgi:competence protein ComEA
MPNRFCSEPTAKEAGMNLSKSAMFWLLAAFALVIIIVISAALIWVRRDNGIPITILTPEPTLYDGQILVDGAVAQPGIYRLKTGDTLDGILQISGGTSDKADLSRMRLYVPSVDETQESQKVDINKADAWMLEVLPDIGAVRAAAIISYRTQNGFFGSVSELTKVPGISSSTFEKIRDMITISN